MLAKKEIKEAVVKIMEGETYYTQEATQAIMDYYSNKKKSEELVCYLTQRKRST